MSFQNPSSSAIRNYRYHTCLTYNRKGQTTYKGRSISMGRLDTLVVDHLSRRLFTAKRLTEMLVSLPERRANRAAEVDGRVATLQREASEAEDKLKRLYKMVEDGIAEMDDILEDADRQPEARPGAGTERTGPH